MGFDLIAPRRHFEWSNHAWRTVLEIATRHGWTAMGTGPPKGTSKRAWIGIYDANDGQLLRARDAMRLADALEVFVNQTRSTPGNRRKKEAWFWSPSGKQAIREFVRFCRKGSFRIH
jgi:hypothetical protein